MWQCAMEVRLTNKERERKSKNVVMMVWEKCCARMYGNVISFAF